MLRPSYTELMLLLNNQQDVDNKITSRYTIVIAAAKRARQLIDGRSPLIQDTPTDKAVSIAVNEMYEGKVLIKTMQDNNKGFESGVEVEGLGVSELV